MDSCTCNAKEESEFLPIDILVLSADNLCKQFVYTVTKSSGNNECLYRLI